MKIVRNLETGFVVYMIKNNVPMGWHKGTLYIRKTRVLDVTPAEFEILRGVANRPDFKPNRLKYIKGQWSDKAAKNKKLIEIIDELNARLAEPVNNVAMGTAEARDDVREFISDFDGVSKEGVLSYEMADGSIQDLTKAQLVLVRKRYARRKSNSLKIFRQLKNQLEAAATLEEIDDVWLSEE